MSNKKFTTIRMRDLLALLVLAGMATGCFAVAERNWDGASASSSAVQDDGDGSNVELTGDNLDTGSDQEVEEEPTNPLAGGTLNCEENENGRVYCDIPTLSLGCTTGNGNSPTQCGAGANGYTVTAGFVDSACEDVGAFNWVATLANVPVTNPMLLAAPPLNCDGDGCDSGNRDATYWTLAGGAGIYAIQNGSKIQLLSNDEAESFTSHCLYVILDLNGSTAAFDGGDAVYLYDFTINKDSDGTLTYNITEQTNGQGDAPYFYVDIP